jgi:hypothetical protein
MTTTPGLGFPNLNDSLDDVVGAFLSDWILKCSMKNNKLPVKILWNRYRCLQSNRDQIRQRSSVPPESQVEKVPVHLFRQ